MNAAAIDLGSVITTGAIVLGLLLGLAGVAAGALKNHPANKPE